MEYPSDAKSARLLAIYSRLTSGEVLKKADLAQHYQVTQRSIQRDIGALRQFLSDQMLMQDIIYDSKAKGYRLTNTIPRGLTNSEILAVCKVLLDSRSLKRDEMLPILDKLIECCVPAENRKAVERLISNEKFHYIEPHHGKPILEGLWELGLAIQQQRVIEIQYDKLKGQETVHRVIEPVGLLFSEFYFYLVGFICNIDRQAEFENPDDIFPTIYRVDRIQSFQVTEQHFRIPYAGRFEEGEFRKRVQFMYGGKLQRIRFRYTGPSLEAVLDRLPTAIVKSRDETGTVLEAEVYGKGILMWLLSQGKKVELLSPESLREETKEMSHDMLAAYD